MNQALTGQGLDRLGALDTSYSFPSGHTLNSAVLLALVGWLLWPSLGYAGRISGTVWALTAAFSRQA